MGHVQSLKTTLNCWVSKILAELFSAFIKRRVKLIMKKRGNSSQITSSQNHLTTESLDTIIATSSADTTERTIMEKSTEDIVNGIVEWAKDRFDRDNMSLGDCRALYEEYAEWFEPQLGDDLEVISVEEITPEEFERYRERS